ncbi:hypothetical protein [Burkholderia contaminans]|uniref:hypothetical protein n=1 Tax=Burkholderia contaminans TaxID=488447 RepID=UPI0030D13404
MSNITFAPTIALDNTPVKAIQDFHPKRLSLETGQSLKHPGNMEELIEQKTAIENRNKVSSEIFTPTASP